LILFMAALAMWLVLAFGQVKRDPMLKLRPLSDPSVAPISPRSDSTRIAELVESCGTDYARIVDVVMGDAGFWSRQKEIGHSLAEYPTTLVPAGNGVGKSYSVARLIEAWLIAHRNGIAVTVAPTQEQLQGVLWKEMRRAWRKSKLPLGGHFTQKPLKFTLSDEWFAVGLSSNSVEAMSGQHAKDLLFVADEASGVDEGKFEAGNSLNPSRRLFIGNPLRPHGKFFELCEQAESGSNPFLNLIRIPSTESPHAHLDRSPVGMADRLWLEAMAAEYGTGSIWWKAHVLALFPTETAETLLKRDWLTLASRTLHIRSGPTRIAIDLASGNGGDRTVIICRDDNGLLAVEHSNEWSLEESAAVAARIAREFKVHPSRVSFDRGALGEDFGARLAAVGLPTARAYLGGSSGGKLATNLRSLCARELKRRLDPDRTVPTSGGIHVKQHPFAIRPDWIELMRPELMALRYVLADGDGSPFSLEPKEVLMARLKHSPDFADALTQSFAFPG
jgi:hypothetical protein